ncbi:MAG: hypothetical protein OYG32_11255 [Rhodospirillaceae bacterium]|nr:hypothetical protein [Rhodospirillaceae bacterium]MDE0255364.1 hypothetical protein [Rhodospirillaceae bacterium]MDE0619326.1 hypothetical protein [Rhodospirillaceae bacterium]
MHAPIRSLALAASLALLAASPAANALNERQKCVYVLKGEGWPDRPDRMDGDGLTAGDWCLVQWAGRRNLSCANRGDAAAFLDVRLEISRHTIRGLKRNSAMRKRYRAAERRHAMAPPAAPPPSRMWEIERLTAKLAEQNRVTALYRACLRTLDRLRSH